MSRLRSFNIEYANFLCHFGEQVLLDRYSDIFYPAITSDEQRIYGDTSFIFNNIKHIRVEANDSSEAEYFLYGKIIKDFVYKRDQLLDHENNELKLEHGELRDSPSSTFILSLKDHRLYFIREFQLGPTLEHFKSLVETLIKKHVNQIIDGMYKDKKEMRRLNGGTSRAVSKSDLKISYPIPDIKIIKLSSPEGIEEFIKSMKTVNSFSLTINKTNHESDLSTLFKVLRDQNKEMGAGSSNKVTYTKGKQSLNHDKVTELAQAASHDSNVNFVVKGIGIDGSPLNGTENEFTAKMPIAEIEKTPELMTLKAYKSFWKLISDGIVKQPTITNISSVREKIKKIIEFLEP